MSGFDHTFRAAIPGMSLAHHRLGDLPHEKPSKYTNPQEAAEYIWKQLNRKDMLKQLWQLLEGGATVFSIARAVLYKMALEGVIQMNLAVTLYITVEHMILTLGKAKKIDGIKVHPEMRDPVKDKAVTAKLQKATGGEDIPNASHAFIGMPKAEDITKDTSKFLNKPMPKHGLVDMAKGNE